VASRRPVGCSRRLAPGCRPGGSRCCRPGHRQGHEIVAELTGYPADLLDPDLDLEADLGVDTVKQAEVFAAVRGALQRRTRREPEAARLPDDAPRRRLGPRQARPARAVGPLAGKQQP
jgi:hypothetical protein